MQTPTIETSPATIPNQPSTRHLVVDRRYAAILHEDFPIVPAATILEALTGEPQRRASAITEWAAAKDDPAGALLAWSRKHHKGQHRRCRRTAGTPPERPDHRHGPPQDNRAAPGRGSAPSAGADVDSLRGVRVSADTLDAIAAKLGV